MNASTLVSDSSAPSVSDWRKDTNMNQEEGDCVMSENGDATLDSMLCDTSSRLITTGLTRPRCTDEHVMFINCGGEVASPGADKGNILCDSFFQGGDVLLTDECIAEGGDYPFIYQSARFGNFCYQFDNLHPGDYFVDLHFAEIIFINGPKGMRVFNVFLQEEKVLSEFDVFSVIGANKPLQVVDLRVSVKEDGVIVVRFEGVNGSPLISGICVRNAPQLPAQHQTQEFLRCNNCSAEIEFHSAQKKFMRTKSTAKYEKKIQELTLQFQQKTDECYQAWMSLTAANEQLEKVMIELDNKRFQTYSLDQAMEKQAGKLMKLSHKYEREKMFWIAAINDLEGKIKIMKQEHAHLSCKAHECAVSIPELNKMVSTIQVLVTQCEDLKVKYTEEQAKRRKLYNEVQEAKGSIRVFCRCRPLSYEECSAGYATVVDFDAAKDGDIGILSGGTGKRSFKFDRVYTPKDNQSDVFADASPLVVSVLDGYNVCIFAYGQTGTGKTFTMEGTNENRGVNYRTLETLFQISKERSDTFTYDISVSVLEVYNEQIRDLLTTSPPSKKLEIKQASEGSHHVPGIVDAKVENIKEVWNVLQAGSSARVVGSNNVNEHSSRSHCILCVMVKAKNLMNGECTKSKLWLVDLAGSERLAKTEVQGERLKEAQNINKSLSALGDVISALANKSSHIPYRNSKLTHLLQDSLGGDSKTLMFVQISPSEKDLSETLSSLNFATRVRGIELGPAKRQIDTGELQKMKMMLDKARQESRSKDESLRKLEESLQNLENKARGRDQSHKSLQERIKDLEGQLELKMAFQSQSERQLSQVSERLKSKEDSCNVLQLKVKELEQKLRDQSSTYEKQVGNLESKIMEQMHQSDTHSIFLQHKVRELERKLEEQEQNSESSSLHQKIKELEDRLREEEQKLLSTHAHDHIDLSRATPIAGRQVRATDEFLAADTDSHILRSSNSSNRPAKQESMFIKGGGGGRKRNSRSGEAENRSSVASIFLNDSKGRQSDPTRQFPKAVTRASKPSTIQKPFTLGNRTSKDHPAQGVKERDGRKRIWSR